MAFSSSPERPQLYLSFPSVQHPSEHSDNDSDIRYAPHSPRTSSDASLNYPLLPDVQTGTSRSQIDVTPNFVSSLLNPNPAVHPSPPSPLSIGSRAQSRLSMVLNRVASEESQALTSQSSLTRNRTSMILYRLADESEQRAFSPQNPIRHSVLSSSGDSVLSVSYDSKYPWAAHTPHKLVPYPFDPSLHIDTPEEDDALHDPSDNTTLNMSSGIAFRGFVNVGVLILVILALLCLFIFYPVWRYVVQRNSAVP